MYQHIEAQNIALQIGYGTTFAKDLTLSFWVKSNKTGDASVGIFYNIGSNRTLYFTIYNFNSANTWEYKTVTFAPNSIANTAADNGAGMTVEWWINSGSSFSGTAATGWVVDGPSRNSSNIGIGGAVNDYFQITGVQLEVGSKATPFEHRSFHDEQLKCMRYFQYFGQALASGAGNDSGFMTFANYSGGAAYGGHKFTVPMRARPTMASNNLQYFSNNGVDNSVVANLVGASYNYGEIRLTSISVVQGQAGWLRIGGTDASIQFSAEL